MRIDKKKQRLITEQDSGKSQQHANVSCAASEQPVDNNVPCPMRTDTRKQQRYYFFDAPLDGLYITHREAECAYLMLHGYTNTEVAHRLNLSPRTVEYYLKNMRDRLCCYSKIHLLRVINSTNFMSTFKLDDADIMD